MADLADRLRTRIVPAILTAVGVALLAGGLISFASPVTADPIVSPAPTQAAVAPTAAPLITLPPIGSAAPSTAPSAPADRVATRIRIAALKIDLPVMKPPGSNVYPLCNVASYIDSLGQPGQGRATYIYAHARVGMFLPLLRTADKKMIGMIVEVWTSDDQRFLYEITDVRRHVLTLDTAFAVNTDQLWLQTSEGPHGTPGKTQIIATPLSQEAAPHADAHPVAKPVVCG